MFSKMLPGRNEHIVKNKYISILRSLKKRGRCVNQNNFQEVLDTFKKVSIELDSKKIIPKPRNSILEKSGSVESFNIENEIDFFEPTSLFPSNSSEILEDSFQQNLFHDSIFKEPVEDKDYLGYFNLIIKPSLYFFILFKFSKL